MAAFFAGSMLYALTAYANESGTASALEEPAVEIGVIYSGNTGAPDNGPGTAHWEQDGRGWWYQHEDGSYTQNGWEQLADKWYYFDADGYMLADAWVESDGKRYRMGADGAMLTDQQLELDGVAYTIAEDGTAMENVPEEQTAAKSETELQAEAMAANIVAQITNDGMSKPQKANAIYNWVRANMTYTASGPKSDPAASALYGFRRRSGCCYEYYAMSKYLLEAAGMPNIMVTRASDGDHFWNLVNVDGAWYHFDATPRRTGGRWCLVTTAELQKSWQAHNFDISAYPQTP